MILLFLLVAGVLGFPAQDSVVNTPASRKVLGSSVVTSVSVIMDAKDTHYSDAVGKPVPKPQSAGQVASPINLLNPDRYEFYTFDDSGDLVKRLMTLEEIQSIIANGDGDSFNYNAESYTPEKKVNDVVNNVQNVLKEEIMSHKNTSVAPILDTPDVSSSWSMILPAIFGNSGEQIKPGRPVNSVTADTIMVEDQAAVVQKPMPFKPSKATTQRITTKVKTGVPLITVAIISNKNKVNAKPATTKKPVTYKPMVINNQEVLKDAPVKKPAIKPSTYRPSTYKVPSSTKPYVDDDDDEYPNQHKSTTARPTTTTIKTTTTLPRTKSTGEPMTTPKRVYFEEFEELAEPVEITTARTSTTFIKLDTRKPVSQFIQLFEYPTTPKQMIEDDEIPPTRGTSQSPLEYGTTVFVIDHKTNTRIPITTKEQLATLLNSLPHDSTTELLKPSSSNNFVQTVSKDESEFTRLKQTTESVPVPSLEKNNAQFEDDEIPSYVKPSEIPSQVKPTTAQESKYPSTEDIDKISVPEILDQLLLTSTNIYEINTELGNKSGDLASQTTENLVAASTNAIKQVQQEESATTPQKEYTLALQQVETTPQVENTTPEKLPEKEIESTTLEKDNESTTPKKDYESATTKKDEASTAPKNDYESMTTKKDYESTAPKNDYASMTTKKDEETTAPKNNYESMTTKKYEESTATNDYESMTTKKGDETTAPKRDYETMTTKKYEESTAPKNDYESMTTKKDYESTAPKKDYETMTTKKYEESTAPKTNYDSMTTKQDDETTAPKTDYESMTTKKYEETTAPKKDYESATTKKYEPTTLKDYESTTLERFDETTMVLRDTTEASTLPKQEKNTQTVEKQETTFSSLEEQAATVVEFTTTAPQTLETSTLETTEVITEKTEPSIINSIEQLIQQAVGNIAGSINNNEKDGEKVGALMADMNDKPMSVVQMESATVASNLLDNTMYQETTTDQKTIDEKTMDEKTIDEKTMDEKTFDEKTTDEKTTNEKTMDEKTTDEKTTDEKPTDEKTTEYDILSEAMDSILSQVVSSEKQGLTTLDFSTKTTDAMIETTEALNDSVGANSENADKYEENEIATTTETTPQPAYFTELTTQKPISLLDPSEIQNEILNTEASSYIDEALTTNKVEETTTDLASTKQDYPSTTITTAAPAKIAHDEDIQRKTTIVAIITKPAVKYEDGELVTQSTVLKAEVKKDDSPDSNKWSLVSTISPINKTQTDSRPVKLEAEQGFGLEDTTAHLDPDIYQFVSLCNELAFGFWNSVNNGMSAARSVFVSPFAATSLLAMVFLGARGATSGEMNEILRLDDMVTFNPHLILKNITESIAIDKKSGVATSVILRELYSDKSKGHLLNFYKERAKQFYDGHVEEVSFKEVGDVIRRRTNLIVKRQTWGRIPEFIKDSSITVKAPLAGVSISIFQTDCSTASTEGRDGELYFVVLPSIRQRRLIPVPAAVWRTGFLAGYEPGLDATAVAIGGKSQTISTIFVIPGQQGISAPGDGLARLERHLIHSAFKDGAWTRLMKSLIPRPGLEVQIPRYSHRSVINASVALQHMGMKDLFDSHKADLRGLNGVANDLYLSDILQINNFATCGEDGIGDTHHSEIYPATANRTYRRSKKFKDVLQPENAFYDSELLEEPRDYQRAFHDPLHDPSLYALPLPLRPRQARLPDAPRLRFDRPFLYFVRHNPTGLILHMGRFNPRLLP